MDNGFTTKQWKHGRRRSSITRNNFALTCFVAFKTLSHYYGKMWFGMISNQITKLQIKSKSNHTFSKSNHYVWFSQDLNQIMIWICPSLVNMNTYVCQTVRWVSLTLWKGAAPFQIFMHIYSFDQTTARKEMPVGVLVGSGPGGLVTSC